jgi:hypothetical protein
MEDRGWKTEQTTYLHLSALMSVNERLKTSAPFVPSVLLGGKNYLQPLAFSLQPLLENA